MERNEENILKTAAVAFQCQEEDLLPLIGCPRGNRRWGRIADESNKLTARFSKLVEIIFEADGWARSEGKSIVTKSDVEKAINKRNIGIIPMRKNY